MAQAGWRRSAGAPWQADSGAKTAVLDARGGAWSRDRAAAGAWARALLESDEWVILDTETTGLGHSDEVVQIGVIGAAGETLLETLVRPGQPIPGAASAIHGITDAMVAEAPPYAAVRQRLQAVVAGRRVVSYNAAFDERLILQTAFRNRVPTLVARWECAMRRYAAFVGRWSERHGGYVYPPLPRRGALAGQAHTALADCLATREVIQEMAGASG